MYRVECNSLPLYEDYKDIKVLKVMTKLDKIHYMGLSYILQTFAKGQFSFIKKFHVT